MFILTYDKITLTLDKRFNSNHFRHYNASEHKNQISECAKSHRNTLLNGLII